MTHLKFIISHILLYVIKNIEGVSLLMILIESGIEDKYILKKQ